MFFESYKNSFFSYTNSVARVICSHGRRVSMPILHCEVSNCVHNQNCLCELGEIAVKGHSATISDATCCSTFCNCDGLSNENVAPGICECSEIRCSATNCKHNRDCNCTAHGIDVCGCGAQTATNTVCSTFECK